MDINLIKRLIKIVEQSEVTEFSVQEGELKIKISKNAPQTSAQFQSVHTEVVRQAVPTQPVTELQQVPAEQSKSNHHEIRSPIVGTFYRAPSPDADVYVHAGDTVLQGTVLCIVEAMKLMNEIESDCSGKIVKILVENGTPVEYNQPLFLVEKN
ncbi:MAG: acetyl-CoA carboxylase biotin carboxyl carrier protein [Bacteroidota bacterium]